MNGRAVPTVLLVHGMARTPASLLRLGLALRRAGWRPAWLGYVAALEPFDAIRARLRRRLEALAAAGAPYAVVGHSLGGLLTRAALAGWPSALPRPHHLVMLGTPNRSPRLARRLARTWPYRLVNGDCGQRLADPAFFDALPPAAVPVTLVVGTAGPVGRWSPFGEDQNDGVVAVEETVLAGAATLLLPVRHTFMMNAPAVRAVLLEALGAPAP